MTPLTSAFRAKRSARFLAAIIVWTLLWAGCGGGGGGSSGTASLRIVNGFWGGNIIATIDGTPVDVPQVACVNEVCTALSQYTTVGAGGAKISIMQVGSTTNAVPTQLQNLKLAPNSKYTIAVYGSNTATGTDAALLQDDDVPAANLIKVKIVDISANVLSASAWFVPTGTQPSGNPTIGPVSFGSASAYMTLQPNTYDIYIPQINCGFDSNCNVDTVTLNANQNFSIYLLFAGLGSGTLILADN
jgi:uncharacterized protein DUF4397